jgi:hypothetical protein
VLDSVSYWYDSVWILRMETKDSCVEKR